MKITFPEALPISAHRHEIADALRGHPVIIVCGDTGSGKTTQLPKIALTCGYGDTARIACTQPRRIATTSMAGRLATELQTELGGFVGYQHRFENKTSAATRVKFMTDGVLLAETRRDALLRAYDCVIIDEAHERSLNIDFLLGLLKRILAKRPQLRLIISSATLDAERFSAFFDNAPVVNVPGRLFPIETRWRPSPDGEEADLPRMIANALDELPANSDTLVFLPGERDIRETAELLVSQRRPGTEVFPLLASLPAAEQQRALREKPEGASWRRVILATNVAETSITIDGILAVIDTGLARISRYNPKTRVQRLHIEPVSQASANQRQGRCGRTADGICIRLYDEASFAKREPHTAPEIHRTALSGVILIMLDLRLGDIADFPFIDPPGVHAIRDGIRELHELNAIEADGPGWRLTHLGRKLTRLPVEPSLARILIAAHDHAALRDALVVVAALECDDPRRRPIDKQAEADLKHKQFLSPVSDFSAFLKLWRWHEDHAKTLSRSALRRLCTDHFLSFPKMREWSDLHDQLTRLAASLGLDTKSYAGGEVGLHKALLTGLLSNIGKRDPQTNDYQGAHSLRFALFPGSGLILCAPKKNKPQQPAPKKPRPDEMPASRDWILAGERVDTSRLFARTAACINPEWIEPAASHLCKYSYHSPMWDTAHGFARIRERVVLHGLLLSDGRLRDLSRIDPPLARELFIDHALIDGDCPRPPAFLRKNADLLNHLRDREAKERRHGEIIHHEKLHALFDAALPPDICSADALRRWASHASPAAIDRLTLHPADFPEADDAHLFPDTVTLEGRTLPLTYRHAPGADDDGITCALTPADIPAVLNWRHDWLVPGALPEKIRYLIHHLPPQPRRLLSPLNETASRLLTLLKQPAAPLTVAIANALYQTHSLRLPDNAFPPPAELPPHLRLRFLLLSPDRGKPPLLATRDPADLLPHAPPTAASPLSHQPSAISHLYTSWTFDPLPPFIQSGNAGWAIHLIPALVDTGDAVRIETFPDPAVATREHRHGLLRLAILAYGKDWKKIIQTPSLPFATKHFLHAAEIPDATLGEELARAVLAALLLPDDKPLPRDAATFNAALAATRSTLGPLLAQTRTLLLCILHDAAELERTLETSPPPAEIRDDLLDQLAWLIYPGFITLTPLATLREFPRYLEAIRLRLDRARLNPAADIKRLTADLLPLWNQYKAFMQSGATTRHPAALTAYRWMLEEFRVSLFAQQLKTPYPASAKRLATLWQEVIS